MSKGFRLLEQFVNCLTPSGRNPNLNLVNRVFFVTVISFAYPIMFQLFFKR